MAPLSSAGTKSLLFESLYEYRLQSRWHTNLRLPNTKEQENPCFNDPSCAIAHKVRTNTQLPDTLRSWRMGRHDYTLRSNTPMTLDGKTITFSFIERPELNWYLSRIAECPMWFSRTLRQNHHNANLSSFCVQLTIWQSSWEISLISALRTVAPTWNLRVGTPVAAVVRVWQSTDPANNLNTVKKGIAVK